MHKHALSANHSERGFCDQQRVQQRMTNNRSPPGRQAKATSSGSAGRNATSAPGLHQAACPLAELANCHKRTTTRSASSSRQHAIASPQPLPQKTQSPIVTRTPDISSASLIVASVPSRGAQRPTSPPWQKAPCVNELWCELSALDKTDRSNDLVFSIKAARPLTRKWHKQ